MKTFVSKLGGRGGGAILAFSVLLALLAVVGHSDVATTASNYDAAAVITVVDKTTGTNSNRTLDFSIPEKNLYWKIILNTTPVGFGGPAEDLPIGAWTGELNSGATLGVLNDACNTSLPVSFKLQNATTNTNETCTYKESMAGCGLGDQWMCAGVECYPAFLNTLFPGLTPTSRSFGYANVAGSTNVTMNIVVFPPGTTLFGKSFDPALGSVLASVLQDPTQPIAPTSVTDNCTPMSSVNTTFGISKDNPQKEGDQSGYVVTTNPCAPGTYTFTTFTSSAYDPDGDGWDNDVDQCPFQVNCGDPTVKYSCDLDDDGLDSICDPNPLASNMDQDGDGYQNRQDNCPLVANGQAAGQEDQLDTDRDGIGDICDVLGAGGIGRGPNIADGTPIEVTITNPIEITGDDVCAATPTPTAGPGEGTPTTTAGTATATATVVAAVETTLAEDAAAGDTEIVVADATGFAVGDAIKIGSGDNEETNTIEAIDGETITLATALEFDHDAGDPVVKVQAIVATPSPTIEGDICSPVFPGTYNGRVLINGTPAASGYELTASIGDTEWGSAIISGGRYAMDIPDHMPTVKPCFEGGTITFALNGMTCAPAEEGADEWGAGIRDVDLDCAPVAPPVTPTVAPATPTPTTKPPAATPTLAPTKVPSTGAGGLSGANSGLPLWAMALASWAGLMTVAGLGSLIAAKRR